MKFIHYYMDRQDQSTGYSGKMCSEVLDETGSLPIIGAMLDGLKENRIDRQGITCLEQWAGRSMFGENTQLAAVNLAREVPAIMARFGATIQEVEAVGLARLAMRELRCNHGA